MSCPNSGLLDPELVHAGERVRVLILESGPTRKVAEGGIVRKPAAVCVGNVRRDVKPDESQPLFVDETGNIGNRRVMLLDMEQEITAFTRGVVVAPFGDFPVRRE